MRYLTQFAITATIVAVACFAGSAKADEYNHRDCTNGGCAQCEAAAPTYTGPGGTVYVMQCQNGVCTWVSTATPTKPAPKAASCPCGKSCCCAACHCHPLAHEFVTNHPRLTHPVKAVACGIRGRRGR